MGKQFDRIDENHRAFIARQRIFFTASATADARVNVSPRSTEAFRILGPNACAYLDRTGSGNETAAHLLADGRLTVMFCAFEGAPRILRLYGRAQMLPRGSAPYDALLAEAFGGTAPRGARQILRLAVDLVQTSCGYGVPLFDYVGERDGLERWAETKTDAELEAYQRQKNSRSLDGLPTGLFEDA
ncbi:pyridoxamine 5'-phosphate oxidase family protein [Methylobacterium iners]|uniref:Pyridoxamine 5'-phosphate oxidase N-terminal domain-containing protein n=1 Tax=Methylobacterium iners TaxID=418707 RepID=A0ABQ4S2L7_9HYPH|nr:pyridoxamine 5'-phosphate oxidase family protein [Methylobacterium iners]GJD96703.1 hypothetical protein OCOJLMKI_3927 [Methylobacterium iners]